MEDSAGKYALSRMDAVLVSSAAPHMPFETAAADDLLAKGMVGSALLFVGDSGGGVRICKKISYISRTSQEKHYYFQTL